jgi:hypothetical protein
LEAICDCKRKNRSAIRRIEADDILELVILSRAVGIACGARLTVGGGAIAAEIKLTPPVWNAVANAVRQRDLEGRAGQVGSGENVRSPENRRRAVIITRRSDGAESDAENDIRIGFAGQQDSRHIGEKGVCVGDQGARFGRIQNALDIVQIDVG